MASPCGALHRNRHAQKRGHVGNRPVEFLIIHIQRPALGAARLLIQADALHVDAFENRFVQQLARVEFVGGAHVELDATDEIGKLSSFPFTRNDFLLPGFSF